MPRPAGRDQRASDVALTRRGLDFKRDSRAGRHLSHDGIAWKHVFQRPLKTNNRRIAKDDARANRRFDEIARQGNAHGPKDQVRGGKVLRSGGDADLAKNDERILLSAMRLAQIK